MIKTKEQYQHARMTLLKNMVMNEIDQHKIDESYTGIQEARIRILARNDETRQVQKQIDDLPMNKRKDFE